MISLTAAAALAVTGVVTLIIGMQGNGKDKLLATITGFLMLAIGLASFVFLSFFRHSFL